MEKNTTQGSGLLRTAFFSGLTLLLVFGGVLVAIYSTVGTGMFRVREEIGFHRLLQDYDFRYGQILAAGQITISHQLDSLGRDLDHMETRIEGVENWLSVLKRRRRLAAHAGPVPGIGPRHAQIYRDASRRALRAFPFSEPIAAVAAAAAVHGVAITGEREEELRQILPRLSSTGFVPMRLSLHVLLGDFHSPERAAENLLEDHGLSLDFAISAMGRDVEAILTSLVILRILEGETWEALSAIQTALGRGRASDDFIRFAAEFFYDFGNPIRSAELFHMLPGEDALSRQADALWIAGYTEHARHIWALLTAPRTEFQAVHDDTLESRALYNFATTAPRDETEALLERLVRQGRPGERYRELGLIRLSRLRSAPAAVTLLEAERGPADSEGYLPISALVDLEILRRRAETMESARIIADAWMLLRRYYEAEGLFRWAAWYFALQRNFAETAMLLRDAERQGFYGSWKDTHMALQLIREGRFDAAIDIKEPLENTDWVAAANLGRIFEARNATARALEHYEKALTLVMETGSVDGSGNEVASVLQYRIARCLRTMGRLEESRRALRLALEHNPDNLNARIELGRM
ncbi:MAG: tetratricopeptide repeat protein [Treponema sp.]|nr:tetratricopeptide repeat protein [Treponema sp.]